MGNNQASTTNETTNDTVQENLVHDQLHFLNETSKLSAKYFGGQAVAHDPSIHQMQHDLLSFDETLKNLIFRRKTTKQTDTDESNNHQSSTTTNGNLPLTSDDKLSWRCTYCSAHNKLTEYACRRCRQAETKL